jgi:hypothetical protein
MGMLNRYEYTGLVLKALITSVCISHIISAGMNGKLYVVEQTLLYLYFTCFDIPIPSSSKLM